MVVLEKTLEHRVNRYVILFITLHLVFSLFLSEYFVELPSVIKEIVYIPLILLFFTFSVLFPGETRIIPSFYLFVAWLILFVFIGIFNHAPDTLAIRYYLFTTFTYIFFQQFLNRKLAGTIYFILFIYFSGLVFVGVLSLIQNWSNFKSILISEVFFEDLKINRLYLWFNIANIAGGVLSVLILFFYFYTKRLWPLYLGVPVLFVVFSRTSLASFLISILVYWLFKNRRKPAFIVVIALIFAGLVKFLVDYSTQDFAFNDRLELSKSVVKGDINYLGKGIGFVTASGRVANIVVFDNDYLRFIYEIGVFGLILFLIFIFSALYRKFTLEIGCFALNFLIMMYMGEVHSMYPIGFLFYMCLAILQFKFMNDDLVPNC
jgi:hypothetical protein